MSASAFGLFWLTSKASSAALATNEATNKAAPDVLTIAKSITAAEISYDASAASAKASAIRFKPDQIAEELKKDEAENQRQSDGNRRHSGLNWKRFVGQPVVLAFMRLYTMQYARSSSKSLFAKTNGVFTNGCD